MSAWKIAPAPESEWPDLLPLWLEAWKAVGLPVDFDARAGWLLPHMGELCGRGYEVSAARDFSGALGFLLWNEAGGHIDQLAVRRSAQGQGVATGLIDHAKARAKGPLILDVNRDNPRAIAFYRREGFAVTGEKVSERSGLALLDMEWRR